MFGCRVGVQCDVFGAPVFQNWENWEKKNIQKFVETYFPFKVSHWAPLKHKISLIFWRNFAFFLPC